MILLTLAAFVQTPAVAATSDTAMRCWAATVIAAGEANVRVTAQASYHAMAGARADRRGQGFMERYQELMRDVARHAAPFGPGGALEGQAAAVASDCDRLHPLARGVAASRLPTDALDRDLMCLGAVSFLEGASRGSSPGGAPPHDVLLAAQSDFVERLPDTRTQAAGLADAEAVTERVGELLDRSLDFGNTEMVARACLAELGR